MSKLVIPSGVTTDASLGSVLNTLNPLSFLAPGQDYVPSPLIKLFKGSEEWNKAGGPAKAAHLATKTLSGMAVLGLGALGLRSLFHSMKIDNIDNANAAASAGDKLQKIYQRPIKSLLAFNKYAPAPKPKEQKPEKKKDKKKEDNIKKKAAISLSQPYHIALGLTPLMALATAVAVYKKADKHYDRKLGDKLDRDIKNTQLQMREIATKRIKAARGIQDPPKKKKEQKNPGQMQKSAAILPGAVGSTLGATLAVLALLSFGGGFYLTQNNDKNIATYKARKKGLQEYTRARMQQQPVQSRPIDPQLMRIFDSSLNKSRQSIENIDTYKDIMI